MNMKFEVLGIVYFNFYYIWFVNGVVGFYGFDGGVNGCVCGFYGWWIL